MEDMEARRREQAAHMAFAESKLMENTIEAADAAVRVLTSRETPALLAASARVCSPDVTKHLIEKAELGVSCMDYITVDTTFYHTLTAGVGYQTSVGVIREDYFVLPFVMRRTDPDVLAANLVVLREYALQIDFSTDIAAIWATVIGDEDVREGFARAGMLQISEKWQKSLRTSDVNRGYPQNAWLSCLYFAESLVRRAYSVYDLPEDEADFLAALERLKDLAGGYVRIAGMRSKRLTQYFRDKEVSDALVLALADRTNIGRSFGKSHVLENAIFYDRPGVLKGALEAGFAKTWREFQKLNEYAERCEASPEMRAIILDAREKSGVKPPSRLTFSNPESRTALLAVWSARELPDGTLTITSYKGYGALNPATVRIPDKIGSQPVTCVAPDAFAIRTGRTDRICDARAAVREIIVPASFNVISGIINGTYIESVIFEGGRQMIPTDTFSYARRLKRVVIPDDVRFVGSYAFAGCDNLEEVEISESTVLSPTAFLHTRVFQKLTNPRGGNPANTEVV